MGLRKSSSRTAKKQRHLLVVLTSTVAIVFVQWHLLRFGLERADGGEGARDRERKLFEEAGQIIGTNHTNPAIPDSSTAKPQDNVGVHDEGIDDNKTNASKIARGPKCKCLDCVEDDICGGLWRANKFPPMDDRDPHVAKKVHIVLSHCRSDLHWFTDYTQGYNIASINIFTKCGDAVVGAPENATIVVLPNVGRCDHTYASYISHVLDGLIEHHGAEKYSIIMFLKDDMQHSNYHHARGGWLDFQRMVELASSKNGFACGGQIAEHIYRKKMTEDVIRETSMSVYYDAKNPRALFDFHLDSYDHNVKGYENDTSQIFKSNYTNLGEFYNSFVDGAPIPQLVPVCYGGIFAASYSNIKRWPRSMYLKIEKILSRGNNIEEGHYMERSWASLLSTPLQPYQVEALNEYKTRVRLGEGVSRKGSLINIKFINTTLTPLQP